MPRRPIGHRARKWEIKTHPDLSSEALAGRHPVSSAEIKRAYDALDRVTQQVARILDKYGVMANFRIGYRAYAEELWRLTQRFKGKALEDSANAIAGKYQSYGYDTELLRDIARLFGLEIVFPTVKIVLDPDVNIIEILGNAVDKVNPLPVRVTDGTDFIEVALDSTLQSILTALGSLATESTLSDVLSAFGDLATEVTLSAINSLLTTNFDSKISSLATESTLADILAQLDSKTSTLAKESGGNLDAILTSLQIIADWDDADKAVVIPKAKGKTMLIDSGQAQNNSITLRTVTTGKTYYLVGAGLQVLVAIASSSGSGRVEADTGGNGAFRTFIFIVGSTSVAIDRFEGEMPFTPSIPMPFTAGTVIRVRSDSASLYAMASIVGWEE